MNQDKVIRLFTVDLIELVIDEVTNSTIAADLDFTRVGSSLEHTYIDFNDIFLCVLKAH